MVLCKRALEIKDGSGSQEPVLIVEWPVCNLIQEYDFLWKKKKIGI